MVLTELTTYLASQSLGVVGTNIFYNITPETPDALISLFEYGGMPSEPDLGTPNMRLEFPLIQAITRGVKNDVDGPRLVAQNIVTAFTKVINQSLSGVSYKAILAKQAPAFMRRDENFRTYFVCNFQVFKVYSV